MADCSRLRFVRCQDGDSEGAEVAALNEAAQAVEGSGQRVVWVQSVSGEDIDEECVYVLSAFTGSMFPVLMDHKARIIGPMVVLACIKNDWPLPLAPHPVFTYSMHGVTLCCTQTGPKDQRSNVFDLVKLMGGKAVGNFTRQVTHLIAGQVGSAKYTVARSRGIPILTPSWVHSTWTEGQLTLVHASDTMNAHRCPVLSGCVISCTGFTSEERVALQELITNNGASYNGQLTKDSSTHLVVGSTTSEKYRYAIQWGVACVTSKWLYDSISTGYCQDEALYNVEGQRKRSGSDSLENIDSKRTRYSRDNGIFQGITVSISPTITSSTRGMITKDVKCHGGVIVEGDSDYFISPLSLPSLSPPSRNIVTVVWFERCLEAGELLDHTSYFLYQPLPHSLDNTLLSGCVITISQFSGLQRQHLTFLANSLGAKVQECFARYSEGSLLATTHLLLQQPSGDKYLSAVSWNVPPISENWLFECAHTQTMVSVDKHIIAPDHTPNTHALPDHTPNNHTVPDHTPNTSTVPDHTPLSSHTKTPLRSFHPHFDVDAEDDGGGGDSMMEAFFTDNMEKAIDTVTNIESLSSKVTKILTGVVLYVHKNLHDRQSQYHTMVTALGGRYRGVYNDSCTHVLYQGKEISRDKLLQSAKDNHCHIISQHWLLACFKSGVREDELLYPYNYNPQQSLSITLSPNNDESHDSHINQSCDLRDNMLEKQLQHLMDEARTNNNKGQRRFTNKGDIENEQQLPHHKVDQVSHDSHVTDSQLLSITYANDNQQEKLLAMIQNTDTQIDTHPPKDVRQTRSLCTRTRQTRSMTLSLHRHSGRSSLHHQSALELPVVSHGTPQLTDKQVDVLQPQFLLSSLSSSEKADYGSLIHELGGVYIESDHYSNHCTHLIVGKSSRTEKYLAACASGKWVLAKAYLEACRNAGKFVEEEAYEWSKHCPQNTTLDSAPSRWRATIRDSNRTGAFQGWQVLLNVENNKQNGLRRLLEAGGAKVLTITMATQGVVPTLTHAFLNINSLPTVQHLSVAVLQHHGVKCLRPEYIAEYLQKEEVDISSFYIIPTQSR